MTVSVAFLLCAGIALLAAFAPPLTGVTRANFDRLKKGMTRGEIERIFEWGKEGWADIGEPGEHRQQGEWAWGGDDGVAVVFFDENGKAVHMRWVDRPRTFLQKLRSLIPF
jgi:hypothetical protein